MSLSQPAGRLVVGRIDKQRKQIPGTGGAGMESEGDRHQRTVYKTE